MEFRKKPVVIQAVRWTGDNIDAMHAFMNAARVSWSPHTREIFIPTLEGTMVAGEGDWIIRGVKGEYYPCKADIFEATYEAAGNP